MSDVSAPLRAAEVALPMDADEVDVVVVVAAIAAPLRRTTMGTPDLLDMAVLSECIALLQVLMKTLSE